MIREQLLQPEAKQLAAFLTRHTRACECLMQVAGQAEVTYQGRAASTAEAGSYLLIKCDGSLQIHHPKGIKPMNWRPKTDSITVRVEDGFCVLNASRKSPAETIPVVMLELSLPHALEIRQEAGFLLAVSEAQVDLMGPSWLTCVSVVISRSLFGLSFNLWLGGLILKRASA